MRSAPTVGLAVLLFLPAAVVAAGPGRPAEVTLTNPARDIHVVSDRDEPIQEYFRRNRILVCTTWGPHLTELIETKKQIPRTLVATCSQNDDPQRVNTFGAWIAVDPPSPVAARLMAKFKGSDTGVSLVLCRDPEQPGLYRVVGYLERDTRGFFARDKKHDFDGFSPSDLLFKGDPKK